MLPKLRVYIKHLWILTDEIIAINYIRKFVDLYVDDIEYRYKFDEVEFMQYTWVDDKNWKRIFEKDYLFHSEMKQEVKFKDWMFWIDIYWIFCNIWMHDRPKIFEVLWNIYNV
jgi:hypothetical protein